MVQSLGVSKETVEALIIEAQREITRLEREYRGYRPNLDIRDKTVILVDDGIATGSTVRAALRAVRQLKPARLVVAVPTANPYIQAEVEGSVNEFISLAVPEPYLRVGLRYQHFPKVDSDEVRELLDEAGRHYLKVARDRHAP
jgi:putative phosphoribosyl transferase